jgi:hypothetical protein
MLLLLLLLTVVAMLHQHHQCIQAPGILKHNGLLWDTQWPFVAQEHQHIA